MSLVRRQINSSNNVKLTALKTNVADEINVNNPKRITSSAKCSEDQVVRHIE